MSAPHRKGGQAPRRGLSTEYVAAALAVAAIVATSGVLWYTSFGKPSGTLAFSFESASAVHNPATGQTNITAVLLNSGTLPIKLGGIQGVPPPAGTQLVNGTFNSYFYSKNGSLIPHGGGGPPDTSYDGWIRVTYLVTGAFVGQVLTLTSTFNLYGQIATDSIRVTVQDSTTTNSTTETTSSSSPSTSSSKISSATTSTPTTTSALTASTTSTVVASTNSTSSTSTTNAATTTSTASVSKSSTTYPGVSFYIQSASIVCCSANGYSNLTVTIKNTGTVKLTPKILQVPSGTVLISWDASMYSANGTLLCEKGTCASSGGTPDTTNGGWLVVSYLLGGPTPGEIITVIVGYPPSNPTVTESVDVTVT